MESQGVNVNGIRWHVVEHGDGPPVLFLHGFTGSASSWAPAIEGMASQFHCVAIDFLGHGQSDAPVDGERYAIENIIDDLLTVMDTLLHPTFRCIGYSMGGRVALALACAAPHRVEALVLESASPGLKTLEESVARVQSDEALATKVEQVGVEKFVDAWQEIPLFASQKRLPRVVLERQRAIRCQHSAHGLAGSLRGMGTGAQPSYWDRLSHLNVPVLLVTGALDAKFCGIAQDMLEQLPNARHVVVQNAGHAVHLERPDDYIRIVESFFG